MLNLTPSEHERLVLFQAAELARRRRARGLRLNQAEAAAWLLDEALEHARDGRNIPEIRELVTGALTTDDVLPGVAALVPMLVVDGQFPDGTRLITVYDPITPGLHDEAADPLGAPGAVITPPDDIELNAGSVGIELEVTNTGDRAIQVSSHYPFAATNSALAFDRVAAAGRRLDVPAGTTVRFEPGIALTVRLIPFPGGGATIEPRQVVRGDGAA
ncbi:MAG: urease subunit beta [Acidimicrobiia bacterium]